MQADMHEAMRANLALVGSCLGFGIESALPHQTLREGGGTPLRVVEMDGSATPTGDLIQEWPARAGRRAIRLHRWDGGYELWTENLGRFRVLPEAGEIIVPASSEQTYRETLMFSTPISLCAVAAGDLVLHAGAVAIGAGAVLLVAAGGGGKSTTAAAFHSHGHRLLSDDLTRCSGSGEMLVYPGPALVRLRPESATKLAIPDVEPIARRGGKVYLAIEPSRRGSGSGVPVQAVVLLSLGSGPPRLERVDPTDALPLLWRQSFFLPSATDRERCFSGLARLVARVPVWTLRRQLRLGHLGRTVDLVVRKLGQ